MLCLLDQQHINSSRISEVELREKYMGGPEILHGEKCLGNWETGNMTRYMLPGVFQQSPLSSVGDETGTLRITFVHMNAIY